jgi:hypothetical protein
MTKQISRVRRRGTRKRLRPRKMRRDDVEEELNTRIENREESVRDVHKWRKILLKAKIRKGRQRLRRRKRPAREPEHSPTCSTTPPLPIVAIRCA